MATGEMVAGLVGAVVGGGAALIAPWITGRMQKRSREREWEREAALREQENSAQRLEDLTEQAAHMRAFSARAIDAIRAAAERVSAGYEEGLLAQPDDLREFHYDTGHFAIHRIGSKDAYEAYRNLLNCMDEVWGDLAAVQRASLLVPAEQRAALLATAAELGPRFAELRELRNVMMGHMHEVLQAHGGALLGYDPSPSPPSP
ncbi:hypothetical protein [Actinomadura macrotermitis]|uniref:Uncharacterized protein n=1 Tax=Actinomadura macrotermitis TaxID=2585200 RepID=A0A7K0BYJ3_9ACTN|nr:hypothetical protein [Actinomadura macrotermitis]MQY06258.1 hypothetical protein [Actinomadura macrotermitis]